MLPVRLRHFWICKKKAPEYGGKHAGAQQRDYGLQLWWPVSNSGVTGFSVQGLQRPPYTLPRHRLLTCASTYAFTTTLNHFATVVMFHNITPVTYGLPVSKIGPPHSGVTTDENTSERRHNSIPAFRIFANLKTSIAVCLMLSPVVCPLLITPGQCARFIDEELEYLTGV